MSDIATLFARDPFEITDDEFSQIIRKFREARTSFVSAPPAARKGSAPKGAKPAVISLDDLDV